MKPRAARQVSSLEAAHGVISFALRLVLVVAVALLETADQLVFLAGDNLDVVIRELAEFLAEAAFHFFPFAFDLVPVHRTLLSRDLPGTHNCIACARDRRCSRTPACSAHVWRIGTAAAPLRGQRG